MTSRQTPLLPHVAAYPRAFAGASQVLPASRIQPDLARVVLTADVELTGIALATCLRGSPRD